MEGEGGSGREAGIDTISTHRAPQLPNCLLAPPTQVCGLSLKSGGREHLKAGSISPGLGTSNGNLSRSRRTAVDPGQARGVGVYI